jgi:hypothetical protein
MFRALALFVVIWSALAASAQDKVSPWRTDWPTAQEEARRAHKPLFAKLHCKH